MESVRRCTCGEEMVGVGGVGCREMEGCLTPSRGDVDLFPNVYIVTVHFMSNFRFCQQHVETLVLL